MSRIPFIDLKNELARILLTRGFSAEKAELAAKICAESSRDGVYSHGANRFPMYVDYIDRGIIVVDAVPSLVSASGAIERWDGNLGPGNLNAWAMMERTMELARENGMGCVALRNTNHWQRGGTYGWQAAEAGCLAMCWTNTMPLMPPWGGSDRRVGNNPFVMAVPRNDGHIVLDMAMSQFSFGRMHSHRLAGEKLPLPGGYDAAGNLSDDPEAILNGGRVLPIGYWKGSGFSLMLDLFAAALSDGSPTASFDGRTDEYGISQFFMAFDTKSLAMENSVATITAETLDYIHAAAPVEDGGEIRYPGERTQETRQENLKNGVPVDEGIWKKISKL